MLSGSASVGGLEVRASQVLRPRGIDSRLTVDSCILSVGHSAVMKTWLLPNHTIRPGMFS